MKKSLLSLITTLALCGAAAAEEVKYEFVPDFITPPPGKQTIGNGHGEIAVDSAGQIYVSVQEKDAGIQVYSPEGKFIKALPLPNSLHGFVIKKDEGKEYIFAAVLGEQRVLKCDLDGKVVLEIPTTSFPEAQRDFVTVSQADPADKSPKPKMSVVDSGVRKSETATEIMLLLKDGSKKTIGKDAHTKVEGGLKLTNCDVAPNGDIYVVDGYGKSWIFVFDRAGKFKSVFGGPVEPYNFKNTHKIFIDPRFTPARLFCCDRGNNRILHLDLDGKIIGVISDQGMRNPSSASFNGDLVCIAEIAGRVSVWNKEGKMVASLGVNDTKGQTNTPKVEPKDWLQGTVTSPHGITFDAKGNIMETEWNLFGRVLRWNKK